LIYRMAGARVLGKNGPQSGLPTQEKQEKVE
jgi:hypothetical protein